MFMAKSKTTIRDLVQGFSEHIRTLKSPQYQESQLRLHYLDPFWELLGWDVSNRRQVAPQDVEVLVEPSMDSVDDGGLKTREPDYLFRLNGFPRFVVEAKKPAVDVDTDKKAIFQAKRYAWNAAIPFAILTDFEQFSLYDATLRPDLNDPKRGLIKEFAINFPDYPAKWEEFVATFGREAVANGSLEELLRKVKKQSPRRRVRGVDRTLFDLPGAEPVDKVFLSYLETYRRHFAREIYQQNKSEFPEADTLHGAAKLTEAVQRIIDRLVFMRVCEDRGVRTYGALRALLDQASREGANVSEALAREFRRLDHEYNGYLFKFHFSESLDVPDHVLSDFIRTIYPPDGPWDFSAIGDDILGIVYERFLGASVTVRKGQAEVDEKPEVRHAGGVYYTPSFVVDTIIRRVVGPQIAGRTPLETLDVKILDPACGSGSFLVAAFQYLIDHCVRAIAADPSLAKAPAGGKGRKQPKAIAFKDKKEQWQLAPDFKAALLTNCIHGVDIDQQAVEVTVMSLYLKMLEGTLPPNWQRDWLENELLPSLDNNILCGNSLITSDDFDRWVTDKHGGLFPEDDEELRFRMNRFDWNSRTRGFGALFGSQAEKERGRSGFDCIIGNPPYIRVQELNKWAPDECEFYKWRYKSAAKGNYDIYVVFTERCLELLSPTGLLGFIMPHKFWQAKYGEGLRGIVARGKHLRSVVDFTHEMVFHDAAIYTAIHILGSATNPCSQIDIARIEQLTDGPSQLAAVNGGASEVGLQLYRVDHPQETQSWSFVPATRSAFFLRTCASIDTTLGEISARMAQGIRTSMNTVFVLKTISPTEGIYRSSHLSRDVELEPGLLRPFVSAREIRRYELVPSNSVVIVPYERSGTQAGQLVSVKRLRSEFPLTWKYLKSCEDVLRSRENSRMDMDQWYGYVYPKNLSLIDGRKLLVPDIVERPSFTFDPSGGTAFVSGYAITLKQRSSIDFPFLLGLLNSSLLGSFLKDVSTPLRGGWYRPFPQFMEKLPIKLPETPAEKKLADRITESVKAIMAAKIKLRDTQLSDRQRDGFETEVERHEQRINEAVFKLYDVEGLPE
jgi:hypothetical protein